jgi:hypothetical protein
MSKTIKKRQPFQIPTIDEVIEFMDKSMKDWPTTFCEHYGKKFWNSYRSKGWQITHGIMMKDWHAAFWAQWSEVKYPEDQKLLTSTLQSLTHRIHLDEQRRKSAGLFAVVEGAGPTPFDRYLESMDEIFHAWQVGYASDGQLRAAAESLRKNNFLLLPKSQIEQIKADQGNNADLGKLLAIRQFFANLKQRGTTVSAFIRSKTGSPDQKTA